MRRLALLICCLCVVVQLSAEEKLRINQLLPDLLCPLAVEPAIPSNFVAASREGEPNIYEGIFWGPKETLKRYFENPASLKEPILFVELSAHVAQKGPTQFTVDFDDLDRQFRNAGEEGCAHRDYKWGNYPIKAICAPVKGQKLETALVGLNDPNGWVLMVHLIAPEEGEKVAAEFWRNFLENTRPLSDWEFFKALGQDLQKGYTLVDQAGIKLKGIAERRKEDGKLLVAVIPTSPHTEFEFDHLLECALGSKWNFGAPLIKIYGTSTMEDCVTCKNELTHVISVMIKPVQEFSVDPEQVKKIKGAFVQLGEPE